jgi:hypothetical protein
MVTDDVSLAGHRPRSGDEEVGAMSMSDDDEDRELARLLADPSLWLDPDPANEARVLDMIQAERPSPANEASGVVPMRPRRRPVWSHAAAGLLGAAAAAIIAVIVTRAVVDDGGSDANEAAAVDATVELVGTDLAPGFVGTAEVTNQQSGVLIRLTVPGLPRREGDQFYEGWLRSCDGLRAVPIGTFHDMDRAAGWAGVSVDDYPVLSVTAEQVAGPTDPAQGTSGEVVVSGAISPCPDT